MTGSKIEEKTIAVIGGGAAGFFTAITAAEADPLAVVTLFEQSGNYLSKVRISGGGRCNVTHACFDPALLAKNYPRGSRELRERFTNGSPRTQSSGSRNAGSRSRPSPTAGCFPILTTPRPSSIAL